LAVGKEQLAKGKGQLAFDEPTNQPTNQSTNQLDIGFRVYRLDTSNMQDVYYKPQDFKQENLDLFASNIKPDRTPEDLLTQVMLSWGLPLHYKIATLTIQGKQVFKIEENSLFACFDNGIDEAFAKEIATHLPLRIVFKDESFKDDTAKENVKQLLKQLSANTEMKVI
jgi:adenine-specific DNA-methyltransferase